MPAFNSSLGWLLLTRTRGAWWCRYRGHCRSGPRHRSPRSRVCAQEWYCKDIHSHIHSHKPMHHSCMKFSRVVCPLPPFFFSFFLNFVSFFGFFFFGGGGVVFCWLSLFLFFVGFLLLLFVLLFFCLFFSVFGGCLSLGADWFFLLSVVLLTTVVSRPMTPGDSDTWSLMMSLSRTLQVRP